ncbi:MAG: hypothetical protein K0S82_892 [Gaiellaceae bacterium]|nr:hypothetical protein [Gaiellaceae bacterium]
MDLACDRGGHQGIRLRRRCVHGLRASWDRHRRRGRRRCPGPRCRASEFRRIAAVERPGGLDPDRGRLGRHPHAARFGDRLGRGRCRGRRDRRNDRSARRAAGGFARPARHATCRRSARLRGPPDAAPAAPARPAACRRADAGGIRSAGSARGCRARADRVSASERSRARNGACRSGAGGGGTTVAAQTPLDAAACSGDAPDRGARSAEAASAAAERSRFREAGRRAGHPGSAGGRVARDRHGASVNRPGSRARTRSRGNARRAETRACSCAGFAAPVDAAPRSNTRPGRPPPAPPTGREAAHGRSGGAKPRAYHGRP